jgi:hypothetical protein
MNIGIILMAVLPLLLSNSTNAQWMYHAGYTAACSDAKSVIEIWDTDGFIWYGFIAKYPTIQHNPDWMLGYRDGAICTHKHTPLYIAILST